jgi:hypothetical protein
MEIPKEHAEQYKMLHDEIVATVAETRKLEMYTVWAIAALYAWFVAENVHGAAWLIGVLLVLLAGLRSNALYGRIVLMAGYLRNIEEQFFVEVKSLPGYERYLKGKRPQGVSKTSMLFWIVLFCSSLVAPFLFGRMP